MNRSPLLPLALLIIPSLAMAQSSGWQPPVPSAAQANLSPVMAARLSSLTGVCPVNLMAQQRGTGSMITVDGTRRETTRGLHLTFGNLQDKNVIGATVTVRGYDATPRVMPAGSPPTQPAELTRTISLALNIAGGKSEGSDMTMKSFATISAVDLESIDYADGTSWKSAAGGGCHVVPNGFLLVGSR